MTTTEAIQEVLGHSLYKNIKLHLSNPEILKMACLQCFLKASTDEIDKQLRFALYKLNTTGYFVEDEYVI